MMRSSPFLRALVATSAAVWLSACASTGGPRPLAVGEAQPALRIYDSKAKRFIPFPAFVNGIASADIVFFGEQHNDPATHSAEVAVLAALGERRPHVIVTLEMFERDVQPLVNQYLAGTISEQNFLAGARPWNNYTTDYRPLVELARVRGWPVVAANAPKSLASGISRRGLAMLDTLNKRERSYLAAEHQCPKDDQYFRNFAETMKGHSAGGGPPTAADQAMMTQMTDRFYEAQCAKDEAMGESIATALAGAPKGTVIFQVDGAFHSDFGLGTAARARRRAPGRSSVVLTAVPVDDLNKANGGEHAAKADYVLFTRAPR